jgi:hypothetical protein
MGRRKANLDTLLRQSRDEHVCIADPSDAALLRADLGDDQAREPSLRRRAMTADWTSGHGRKHALWVLAAGWLRFDGSEIVLANWATQEMKGIARRGGSRDDDCD